MIFKKAKSMLRCARKQALWMTVAGVCFFAAITPNWAVGPEDEGEPKHIATRSVVEPPSMGDLDVLYRDLLIKIFSFIRDNKNSQNLAQVCKKFHELIWNSRERITLFQAIPEKTMANFENVKDVCLPLKGKASLYKKVHYSFLKLLPKFKGVKHLDSWYVGVALSKFSFPELAPLLPQSLETLNVSKYPIKSRGATLLTQAMTGEEPVLPNVKGLYLERSFIGDDGLRDLMPVLSKLEALNIRSNKIRTIKPLVDALNNGQGKRLKELDVSHNLIGDTAMSGLIAALPKDLQALDMENTRLEDKSFEAFAQKSFTALKALNVSGNILGSERGKNLINALADGFPNLERLMLAAYYFSTDKPQLGVEGIGVFVEAFQKGKFKALKELAFSDRGVTNDAFKALLEHKPKSLKILDLSFSRITGQDILNNPKLVEKIKELELLILYNNNDLNDGFIDVLKSAAPNVEIIGD